MVKYIGLILVFLSFTSCKYREYKASYEVVEIDSLKIIDEELLTEKPVFNIQDEIDKNKEKK